MKNSLFTYLYTINMFTIIVQNRELINLELNTFMFII